MLDKGATFSVMHSGTSTARARCHLKTNQCLQLLQTSQWLSRREHVPRAWQVERASDVCKEQVPATTSPSKLVNLPIRIASVSRIWNQTNRSLRQRASSTIIVFANLKSYLISIDCNACTCICSKRSPSHHIRILFIFVLAFMLLLLLLIILILHLPKEFL